MESATSFLVLIRVYGEFSKSCTAWLLTSLAINTTQKSSIAWRIYKVLSISAGDISFTIISLDGRVSGRPYCLICIIASLTGVRDTPKKFANHCSE